MSEAVLVQLIIGSVTLISLFVHRIHGSRENKAIATTINGQRTALMDRIDALEREVTKMTVENMRLTKERDEKGKNETDSP